MMIEARELRAGPLRLTLTENGDLRGIYAGSSEILRRVYAAVRDRNWGTIPSSLGNVSVQQSANHFTVTYDAVHKQDDIDFRWRATIVGSEEGRITFAFDGKALSTFLRNRIGLCVHHPLEGCAGKPCLIEKSDGSKQKSQFPDLVAPNQPFLDLRSITHYPGPGLEAKVRFHGEVFETEDHRNWTDANYKTYGTPLSLPFPVRVEAGTEIHQMVEITFSGAPASASSEPSPVRITVDLSQTRRLPQLGLMLPAIPPLEDLPRMNLSWLRVEPPQDLQTAKALARKFGCRLELAVTVPRDLDWARGIGEDEPCRWLVYTEGAPSATPDAIKAAINAKPAQAELFAGTPAYFAELNRNRPDAAHVDGVCYSACPQVHAFDDASVMENASGIGPTIRTAQAFTGGKKVVISPVTLRQRLNAVATGPTPAPPPPDPRQQKPFGAAWTLAALHSATEAGAHSITLFYSDTVARFLEAIDRFGTRAARSVTSSDPLRAAGLCLDYGLARSLWVANLESQPQTVRVSHPQLRDVSLKPYEILHLAWSEQP